MPLVPTCARVVSKDKRTHLVSESDELVGVLGQRGLREAHVRRLLAHECEVELAVAELQDAGVYRGWRGRRNSVSKGLDACGRGQRARDTAAAHRWRGHRRARSRTSASSSNSS
jgi:hypothetical protein